MLKAIRLARISSSCVRFHSCSRFSTLTRLQTAYQDYASKFKDGLHSPRRSYTNPATTTWETSAAKDNRLIKDLFDDERSWLAFNTKAASKSKSAGLLHNRFLRNPAGFDNYADVNIAQCRELVRKIISCSTIEGYRGIVRDLDRLSDLLCRVIDLAEFVRITHPDSRFRDAASRAHTKMFEYMNVLNTTTDLWKQLVKAMGDETITRDWTEEEWMTAKILRRDFEQSAIQLPKAERDRFVDLSNRVSMLGNKFTENMQLSKSYINLNRDQLRGMESWLLDPRRGSYSLRKTALQLNGKRAHLALKSAEDEDVRRAVYTETRTADDTTIRTLEELLATRTELAQLCGYSSFGKMQLDDKMAKSPEAVGQFLTRLSGSLQGNTLKHIDKLLELKSKYLSKPKEALKLMPWDVDFYRDKDEKHIQRALKDQGTLSSYFSLGNVMQGLSKLFNKLYGVRFVPCETSPGETWNPDVRRLDVVSDTDGLIAVLYCDLFSRFGKSPNPAHCTIRCSRRLFESEASPSIDKSTLTSHYHGEVNDNMAISYNSETGAIQQLPTIALLCDFAPPKDNAACPPLLAPASLVTLFHEMGHAIHSILGRTSFQTIAGTRCATDLAELPSVIMESFALDEDVLGLFAQHWQTNQSLEASMMTNLSAVVHDEETPLNVERQILLSWVDLMLHSVGQSQVRDANWSHEIVQGVFSQHSSLGEPKTTRPHGLFGHLVGYGSAYYAYLFDRVIAGRIWESIFGGGHRGGRAGAVSRENGERFKDSVLKWGGGREPWSCIGNAIGGTEGSKLAQGGPVAMEIVGSWGIKKV